MPVTTAFEKIRVQAIYNFGGLPLRRFRSTATQRNTIDALFVQTDPATASFVQTESTDAKLTQTDSTPVYFAGGD